jgi:uncharacterized protein (DUF4415 family)
MPRNRGNRAWFATPQDVRSRLASGLLHPASFARLIPDPTFGTVTPPGLGISPLGGEALSLVSLRRASRDERDTYERIAKPVRPSITTSDEDWDLDGDIPELTAEELATMRPAREALPADVFEALPNGGGRPKAERCKLSVTLRLDQEVVEAFESTGPGWQTRINAILALAVRPLAQNLDEAEALEQQTKRQARDVHRRREA